MESISLQFLNDNLLNKYQQHQTDPLYRRILDGNYELVSYLPGSSIRFWLNDEALDYATHWHPAIEMIMPLENGYTVIVGQEEFRLAPGDILIIPSGALHHLIAPPTGTRLIYLFDFSILSKIRGISYLTPYLSQPTLINRENHEEIYDKQIQLMIRMYIDYFSDNSLRELLAYSHLLEFFATFGGYRMHCEDAVPISSTGIRHHKVLMERLNKVFDYLEEHYTEEITLEKAADIAGFSKFHFSRQFKKCSGYSFYDYLCYLRIKSAESLLPNPELSITELALQSGFASLSTFNRTFKRFKNCTPTEYRNLYNRNVHSL